MKCALTTTQRTALQGLAVAAFVVVVVVWLAFVAGCALPQWRVFQTKVPTADVTATRAQVEGQRRAAAYIAKRTAPPVQNAPVIVADVHDVARSLSASLGEPARAVAVEDREAVVAALSAGLRAKEEQLERWKEFGRKYGGKPLEDTGINLAGPLGALGLVGVIALCVAVPAVPYVFLRVVPLLWGFFRRTTEAVSEFAQSDPEAGERLAATLSAKMDAKHKSLVRVRASKQRIPRKPSPIPT